MNLVKFGKRAVSVIAGLAHFYRPRKVKAVYDPSSLKTIVLMTAGFGSLGDQALALGTQELAARDGVDVSFHVFGSPAPWRKIGLNDVQSLDGLVDGRFGIVSSQGKELLRNHNLIVIGADTIDGAYGEAYTAVRMAALNDAAKSGRIARLVNFSIAPSLTRTSKRFLMGAHPDVELWARDAISAGVAEKLVDRTVNIAPDIGALMQPKLRTSTPKSLIKEKPVMALVPNAYSEPGSKLDRNSLRDYWVRIGQEFSKDHQIVLLPHDLRSYPGDESFCHEISRQVLNSEVWIPADSPDAKAVIAECSAIVSGRMHACVASLSSGIPTIGLEYLGKFEGQFDWYPSVGKVLSYDDDLEMVRSSLRALEPKILENIFENTTWIRSVRKS